MSISTSACVRNKLQFEKAIKKRWKLQLINWTSQSRNSELYCETHDETCFLAASKINTWLYSPCPQCNAEQRRLEALAEFKTAMRRVFGAWPKVKEETFTGKSKPVTFICKCGNEMPYTNAKFIWPKSSQNAVRKCSKCQGAIASKLKRATISEAREIAKTKPTRITVLKLTAEGPTNASVVHYKCECGTIASTPFSRFKTQKYTCKPCSSAGKGLTYIQGTGRETFIANLKRVARKAITLHGDYHGILTETEFKCGKCKDVFVRLPKSALYDFQWCDTCYPRKFTGASATSIAWMDYLAERYSITIDHAGNVGEWRLPLKDGRTALVDGYCEELNLVFEFHGSVWHGDPRSNKPHPFRDITAEELYAGTKAKEKALRSSGYNLVTIWEIDYWNSEWEDLTIPAKYLKVPA